MLYYITQRTTIPEKVINIVYIVYNIIVIHLSYFYGLINGSKNYIISRTILYLRNNMFLFNSVLSSSRIITKIGTL